METGYFKDNRGYVESVTRSGAQSKARLYRVGRDVQTIEDVAGRLGVEIPEARRRIHVARKAGSVTWEALAR